MLEYFQYSFITRLGIRKQTKLFNGKIKNETNPLKMRELKLCKNVEEQLKMKKESPHLLYFYQEAVIQFGFLAMFANAMPIAPFFCLATNVLEIKIKTNAMCYYSRRGIAEGANGIGAWLPIIEMLALICIPINCAIIYFTGDGTFKKSGESSLSKYLEERNEDYWSHTNVIFLTILIEHVLIVLKVVIQALIVDVPKNVIEAEKKRPLVERKAEEFLKIHKSQKKDRKGMTYEERVVEEEFEDAKIIQQYQSAQKRGSNIPKHLMEVVNEYGELDQRNNEREAYKKFLKEVNTENLDVLMDRKRFCVDT